MQDQYVRLIGIADLRGSADQHAFARFSVGLKVVSAFSATGMRSFSSDLDRGRLVVGAMIEFGGVAALD
jgi:hypothetical protein